MKANKVGVILEYFFSLQFLGLSSDEKLVISRGCNTVVHDTDGHFFCSTSQCCDNTLIALNHSALIANFQDLFSLLAIGFKNATPIKKKIVEVFTGRC